MVPRRAPAAGGADRDRVSCGGCGDGMTKTEKFDPSPSSPLRVFAVVTIAGPPVGGLIILIALAIIAAVEGSPSGAVMAFSMLPIVIVSAYLLGGLQAIAVGVILAVFSRPEGRFSYLQALIVSSAVGAVVMAIMIVTTPDAYQLAILLLAVGFIAACTIRMMFFRRFSPTSSKSEYSETI